MTDHEKDVTQRIKAKIMEKDPTAEVILFGSSDLVTEYHQDIYSNKPSLDFISLHRTIFSDVRKK
jgi:hypothetical protein